MCLPTVKDLRAAFEARSNPAASFKSLYQSTQPANASMKKFANPIKTSIDAILDVPKLNPQVSPSPSSTATSSSAPTTPTTQSSPRPAPGKQPSWIGPPKPATLDPRNMKHPVTVEYAHAGLQPPVFVCTSLSEPQWQPIEMDKEKRANGEYRFFKSFSAAEGEYQYKFRLGPGDWWVTDDQKPVVDDGAGNKNNLMTVKAPGASAITAPTPSDRPRVTSGRSIPQPTDDSEPHQRMEASKKKTDAAQASKAHNATQSSAGAPRPNKPHGIDLPVGIGNLDDIPTPGSAPGMEHETEPEFATSHQHQHANVPHAHPLDHPLGSPTDSMPDAAPLMKHESFAAPIETKHEIAPLMKHESFAAQDEMEKDLVAVDSYPDENAVEDDDGPPLLRHESLAPESDEQTQAPLMRHESLALGQHSEHPRSALRPSGSSITSSHSSQEDAVAPEPDPDDKSLEHFPHDRRGIFSHIHRASAHAADHEARDAAQAPKRSPHSGPSSPIASLPSVQEDEDEELESLREQERQEYEREQETGEELDPIAEERPAAPLTPPLTPEGSEKMVDSALDTTTTEDANGATGGLKKDKHIVREYEQTHGPVHTVVEFVRHPTAWFTFAGIAVAVAAGVYKLRYA
ncbi:hypothetical protein D0862_09904 [Hortaea werneckii]|uniref:Uncharacterized protein n=1 Tax=Hortaea werneckii TaxID=91943 RepID=A0A3M7FPA5_HORWE|nr:hypothetical protein D0862_09904 [Hortaea werneckii]